ncbi:MAG: hypothetical protein JO061_20195, partial [Acidobacteriaceae bacterium]|nr:hypothetical protein [Acidobacteriaceae bacterium]
EYDIDNEGGAGKLTLTFPSKSDVQSGMFVGMVFGGGVKLDVQVYVPVHWYSPWKGSWQSVFNQTLKFDIDFIELLIDLIAYLLTRGAADGLFESDPAETLASAVEGGKTFKFLGDTSDPLLPENSLTVTATMTIPIDVMTYQPTLAALAAVLKAVKGKITYGPAIQFGFPSTLSLKSFTVQGGQGSGSTAEYAISGISGNTVTATGPAFTEDGRLSLLTSHVTYTGGFQLGLSMFFTVSACKIFNFSVVSPSLDFVNLLLMPALDNLYSLNGTVDSQPAESSGGACVLAPAMSVVFSAQTVGAGSPLNIHVVLSDPTPTPATVSLSITPPASNFPASVSIPAGGTASNTVSYTFINECVNTGDPDHPDATAPPTPIALTQTYQVRATLTPEPETRCGGIFDVTSTLKVNNKALDLVMNPGSGSKAGPAPPWNARAGATINADPSQPPTDAGNWVSIAFVLKKTTPSAIAGPVKLTLLDEQRQPYAKSNVTVLVSSVDGQSSVTLNPSATVMLTPISDGEFYLQWLTKGTGRNYSNRFFLVVDGGCAFGQNEFWLDVWNWDTEQ